MTTAWYIYGAGGYGMETLDILNDSLENDDNINISFLVDEQYLSNTQGHNFINNTVVTCQSPQLEGYVTIAVGEPSVRAEFYKKLLTAKLQFKSILSQRCYISKFSKIGDGCIIAPFCSIQSTATVKNNVAINTAAIVGHGVVIEESSVISSQVNLGGGVTVGQESYIGMGALIKENVSIGKNVIIGMGSVVHKDIPDGVIAMGNPARPLKKNIDKQVFK